MTKLTRLKKLEIAANEHAREKREKPKDYSYLQDLTDQELNDLFNREVEKIPHDHSLDGLSEQELSELYLSEIKKGQVSHERSTKKSKK